MVGILIKNVPDELHRRLKKRAAANRRSLSSEALMILDDALTNRAGPPSLADVDRVRVRGQRPLTQELVDEARDSGRP